MYVRIPPSLAVVFALGCLASCSGGGAKVGQSTFNCTGASPDVICIQNCNLGCSETGCSRTDIAQNEIVILQFSQDIDPLSVTPSSIRFRTASGDQPVGEFFVNGNQVEFVPSLQISGGETFFGFQANEVYTMTLPAGFGEPSVVRSTSGKPLGRPLSCTLRSSLGIVDLNGVAPRATLISPPSAQWNGAPRNIDIVLEFNELIDATPFLGGIGPVTFQVRRTILTADPNDGEARDCDPASELAPLGGTSTVRFDAARGISVLTFKPSTILPANVCIEIGVGSGVQDISGRPAQPQQFTFKTEQVPLQSVPVTEEFDTTQFFDDEASAATWGNGEAAFARIGGDARHGSFSVNLGADQGVIAGKRTYVINTDSTIIPATNTVSGSAVAVTDGRFFFETMVVPSDVRLRFVGSFPPVFTVAGRLDLQGEIDIAGQSSPIPPLAGPPSIGQVGAAGGIFGGTGGKGGDKNLTGVGALPTNNGTDGQAARVQGGHGYALEAQSTGGKGSQMFPLDGLSLSLIYATTGTQAYTPSAAAGGGGGGLIVAGENGKVVSNNHLNPLLVPPAPPLPTAMGPDALGGAALPIFSFPPPTGSQRSSLHFLVGGAGGGGAGSHACLAPRTNKVWVIGGGGGGGGGAVALRAGDSLRVGPLGRILANGGNTPSSTGATFQAQPGPGGAGSGGSIVLQSGRIVDVAGVLDVRGGTGGTWNRSATGNPTPVPNSASVQIKGGNGSAGIVRLEVPGTPAPTLLATMLPPPVADNVATLQERDDFVSFRSRFYSTQLVFGPEYNRYEIYATVDGVPVVFSDDPTVSTLLAQPGAAIQARFQCATVDLSNGTVLTTRPWRSGVRTSGPITGIQSDGLNAFRFSLIHDTSLATTVTIQRVVVVYRN